MTTSGLGRVAWPSPRSTGFQQLAAASTHSYADDDVSGARCTLWGAPSHPDIPQHSVAGWLLTHVTQRRYDVIETLIGPFVAIVDDPTSELVTIVTDPLGVMPVFVSQDESTVLIGTDAWTIAGQSSDPVQVDGRSLASWLWFGFDCSSHSLFRGVRLLPAGSVTSFTPRGETTHQYWDAAEARNEFQDGDLAGEIRRIVQSATSVLLRDRPEAILSLSGGWDSRFIAACAVEAGYKPLAVCVASSKGEEKLASDVAAHLGLALEVIRPAGDVFDLYPEPFGYTATGYPITYFVTHEIARRHPGRPILNGFLGDSLVRGSHDRVQGRLEDEFTSDLTDVLMKTHSMSCGTRVVEKSLRDCVYDGARPALAAVVSAGRRSGQVFPWVDLRVRQRFYIANNFLQHLDLADPLLPFYVVELLRLKMNVSQRNFGADLYGNILGGFSSRLAEIPHSTTLSVDQRHKVPRRIRRLAASLCVQLCRPRALPIVPRSRAYLRLAAALAGRTDMGEYVKQMYAMRLLETRLEGFGVTLDWRSELSEL